MRRLCSPDGREAPLRGSIAGGANAESHSYTQDHVTRTTTNHPARRSTMRALLLAATAATVAVGLAPSAQAAGRPPRDVLVVSNNWAGTADVIDPHTFKR